VTVGSQINHLSI